MGTPLAGWKVHGFDYLMESWEQAASIFLATSADGSQKSVQFWCADNAPTAYHGHWQEGPGSSLIVQFNGRGPGVYEFEGVQYQRPLHKTVVHPCDDNPHLFKGFDYKKRKITLHYDRTWTVTGDNLFVELAELQTGEVAGDNKRKITLVSPGQLGAGVDGAGVDG